MNKNLYRLVYSESLAMFVPAAEFARSHRVSKSSRSTRRRALAIALAANLAVTSAAFAGTLPMPCAGGTCGANVPNFVSRGAASYSVNGNVGTVVQTTPKAILNWRSFNIGAGSTMNFRQIDASGNPNAGAATLNRIWDTDPSTIAGILNSYGQLYLINQNGIIFANGAQVNASSLVASTLDIDDDVFSSPSGIYSSPEGDSPMFVLGSGYEASFIRIDEGATLSTANGGLLMVLAPIVTNNGTLSATDGQVVAAAGDKVYLALPPNIKAEDLPTDSPLRGLAGLMVEVDSSSLGAAGGQVTNGSLGKIIAERGNVTVAALAVNQMGRISATTSVNSKGSIRLLARDTKTTTQVNSVEVMSGQRGGTLTLGAGSVTEVLPELSDETEIPSSQAFNPSTVELAGKAIELQENASIVVPGGGVTLTAQNDFTQFTPDAAGGSRIYFGEGSLIDTSGTGDVQLSMDDNFVQAELRGTELQDSPLLRNSFLRGKKVWIDIRKGTSLANVSGYINAVGHGVGELTAAGGTVKLVSEGDIVSRAGSSIDVSGGWLNYSGGYDKSTKLVSDGKVYDIADALPNRIYDGFANEYTRTYAKWGVTETYSIATRSRYLSGYVEGKNAGSVSYIAPVLAVEGGVAGSVVAGENQRESGKIPVGAKIILGDIARQAAPQAILISSTAPRLSDNFEFDSILPDAWKTSTVISPELFANGASRLSFSAFSSDGQSSISLDKGTNLALSAGGSLEFTANAIDIQGNITIPGGSIKLNSTATPLASTPADSQIGLVVGDGVTLSTRGLWINDFLANGTQTNPVVIDGGNITLGSVTGLSLGQGSLLDVSGGGWLQSDATLVKGDGGDLTINSNRGQSISSQIAAPLVLGGELRGLALGDGGKLTISAANVQIGSESTGAAGELLLGASFFQSGFSDYDITGRDGVTLQDGTEVQPRVQSLLLTSRSKLQKTGSDIYGFSKVVTAPEYTRDPANLSLTVDNVSGGDLIVGFGSGIYSDAGANISLTSTGNLTVNGTLSAPAGRIELAINGEPGSDSDPGFDATQSIWLSADSKLLARGYTVLKPDSSGLRKGELLSGGTVKLEANKGYVISEAGSLIDVSGTSTIMDLPSDTGGVAPVSLSGDAGNIEISSREGFVLAGTLAGHAGGATASGGSLSLTVDTDNKHPVNFASPYPTGPRSVNLSGDPVALPTGLQPGQAIDSAEFNGLGMVAASSIAAGGFDQLAMKGEDAIVVDGDVSLTLSRSVKLDAPRLEMNGDLHLTTAYAELTNKSQIETMQKPQAPVAGNHNLQIDAKIIDFTGNVTVNGLEKATFNSDGDIRFKSTVMPVGSSSYEYRAGSLTISGDMDFIADQLYPSTNVSFAVNVQDAFGLPTGTIRVLPGGTGGMVLSAAGRLALNAKNIEQSGVIKAPFGIISLNATDDLTLSAGSVTSTSGNRLTIPFGRTQLSGQDYVYNIGSTNLLIDSLPDKAINLNGDKVDLQSGAVVDISGGGDLYAYEFIAGPGGSKDVLDPANTKETYAILPGLGSSFAPYDIQEAAGLADLTPGDQVYLSASAGLEAGYYTLLPARYALLPGAFLVTRVGQQDIPSTQGYSLADGSNVVSGYYRHASTDSFLRDSRSSGFQVRRGSTALTQSEYLISKASEFFADGNLLSADAGRLAISAKKILNLDAHLVAATGANGKGAAVDIAANKIGLIDNTLPDTDKQSYTDQGFVLIDTDKLSNLGASSLLIGGIRSVKSDGTTIDVIAQEVGVTNDKDHALKAPEVILAATDEVKVTADSVIASEGSLANDQNSLKVKGDGALLRVAVSAADLTRADVSRDKGTLDIEAGAMVSGKAITLDATLDNKANGKVLVADNGTLSLSASRINLGETAGVVQGLSLSNTLLEKFGSLADLRLVSYSTIDLYGALAFGNQDLSLTLDGGAIVGYDNQGKLAQFTANNISLKNSNGSAFSSAQSRADGSTPQLGNGTLELSADRITIADGSKLMDGFSQYNMVAKEVVASGTGTLEVTGDLNVTATRVTALSAANQSITASGAVNISKPEEAAVLNNQAESLGAKLVITGASVSNTGSVMLKGGDVSLRATSGDVVIGDGGLVQANGLVRDFGSGKTVAIPAGQVSLTANNGDVTLKTGAVVDVSGVGGGDAGTLEVHAANGQFTLEGGVIEGSSAAADGVMPTQGSFELDVADLTDFRTLNQALNTAGFDEARLMRVRTGDVEIPASEAGVDAVHAHRFQLSTDAGAISVQGTIDASDSQGGSIELYARDNLTVTHGSQLLARGTADADSLAGTNGRGGTVVLASTQGIVKAETTDGAGPDGNPAAGALIDVSGSETGTVAGMDGKVVFSGAFTGNGVKVDSGSTGAVTGADKVLVQANRVYNYASNVTVNSALETTLKNDMKALVAAVDMNGFANTRDGEAPTLAAGLELRSGGNITVSVNETAATSSASSRGWNLNGWDVGPGVLTLRAAGDVNINGTISDGFVKSTTASRTAVNWAQDTTHTAFWSYKFAAGADVNAANSLALLDQVPEGTGNFTLGLGRTGTTSDPAHAIIRTGDGSIDIAARGNVALKDKNAVIYTAGVAALASTVNNFVAPNIRVANVNTSATYPRSGGDIRIESQGDIIASPSSQLIVPWLYRQGALNDDGTLNTTNFANSNHLQPTWWVQYDQFQQGVGALGGGDVTVKAAGDISNLSVSIPTNGRLGGLNNTTPDADNLVVQGGGDLTVKAGGDILSGIFYVGSGTGLVEAGGTLGSARSSSLDIPVYSMFALGDGQFHVTSGTDLNVQHVFNPTVLSQTQGNAGSGINSAKTSYFFTYGDQSSVDFLSLSGDINLINDGDTSTGVFLTNRVNENATAAPLNIYPGSVSAVAANGNIEVSGFTLFPDADGQLNLLAAQDVQLVGDEAIRMSDVSPTSLPGTLNPTAAFEQIDTLLINASEQGFQFHDTGILHAADHEPSRIVALNGSVIGKPDSTFVSLAESAVITAGQDVRDFSMIGQNVREEDITSIRAGRDIIYQANRTANGSVSSDNNSITVGGPGRVQLMAGRDIDLGSSTGVVTIGNFNNPYLPEYGSSIFVQSGLNGAANYSEFVAKYVATAGSATGGRNYMPSLLDYMRKIAGDATLSEDGAIAAFSSLSPERQAAFANPVFYDELRYAGRIGANPDSDSYQNYSAGEALISTLFPSMYQGDVKLFFSQIKTQQGGDIEIFAPGGLVNAGLANSGTLSKTANQLGIVTVDGGSIFAMVKDDFLVNQSRVFTLGGGDIFVWANEGNIDAGKGAKTTVATPAPVLKVNSEGVLELDVSQSVSGSGIGVLLSKPGIVAGDVDLIAPNGEINAGDAGIRVAGNFTGGGRIVGDNIDVGGASIGLPVADAGSLAGSISGVSDVAASATKSASEDVSRQVAQNTNAFDSSKSFIPSFITVEVIGLGD